MVYLSLFLLLLPVAFFALMFTSMFVVCLLEKQHVKQYVPCDSSQLTSSSSYCSAVAQQTVGLGFRELGIFAQDRKSKIYQAAIGFWLSPDGKTLALIVGGTTAKVANKRTNLISLASDGRRLVTTDLASTADPSGLVQCEMLVHSQLSELYERHQQRLAASAFEALVIPHENILAYYESMELARYSRMKQMGLVRPANREETIWKYTVKGAWQIMMRFRKQLDSIKPQVQEGRGRLKRSGAA